MFTEADIVAMLKRNPVLRKKNPQLEYLLTDTTTKPSKHHNIKVYVYEDGYVSRGTKINEKGKPIAVYDSVKEYNRQMELNLLQKAGQITNLQRQVPFLIQPKQTTPDGTKIRAITYKADFTYDENGIHIVEDVKPFDVYKQKYLTTKDFMIKWKLMQAMYPQYIFRLF